MPKAALQKIEAALAIEYTYESNRIEGNTLTLQETNLVVNEGMTISGKTMREHLEAINHAQAISFIKDLAKSEEPIGERSIRIFTPSSFMASIVRMQVAIGKFLCELSEVDISRLRRFCWKNRWRIFSLSLRSGNHAESILC